MEYTCKNRVKQHGGRFTAAGRRQRTAVGRRATPCPTRSPLSDKAFQHRHFRVAQRARSAGGVSARPMAPTNAHLRKPPVENVHAPAVKQPMVCGKTHGCAAGARVMSVVGRRLFRPPARCPMRRQQPRRWLPPIGAALPLPRRHGWRTPACARNASYARSAPSSCR